MFQTTGNSCALGPPCIQPQKAEPRSAKFSSFLISLPLELFGSILIVLCETFGTSPVARTWKCVPTSSEVVWEARRTTQQSLPNMLGVFFVIRINGRDDVDHEDHYSGSRTSGN